ncbi:hypothetical protein D9611_011342 [Ephemerocybe angulata]|uniref:Uncharacterized protein n=1 Tax=Ephemerocybe angulata TaxID=980116 RepID=A0A8H5BD94_9AGAR|nr:hypothetical protein D9611_011342 [Tulosesus angulatus]
MALKNITQTPTHSNTEGAIPSIRLVSATPSSTSISMSGLASPMLGTSATPWDEMPPPPPIPKHHLTSSSSSSRLRPKASSTTMKDAPTSAAPAARLVPKKSKLRMLGSLGRDKQDKRDFSDVVRRVAGNNPSASQSQSSLNLLQGGGRGGFLGGSSKLSLRGGFEIYVEPAGDPEMEDVVVVKKGRGRGGLEGVGWGPKTAAGGGGGKGVLGDVDMNVNGGGKKEGGLKVKGEEGGKWWSIGRGRRDSKEDKKEKARDKENAENVRSKTPDPFKNTDTDPPRTRFNSLDAGILLGLSKKKSSVPPLNSQPISSETYFRSVSVSDAAPPGIRVSESSSSFSKGSSAFGSVSKNGGGRPFAPSSISRATAVANGEGERPEREKGTIRLDPRAKHMSSPALQPQTQVRRMERVPTPPQNTLPPASSTTSAPSFSKGTGMEFARGTAPSFSKASAPSYSRSATPTMGGLLAPPSNLNSNANTNTNASGNGGGLAVPGTNASNSGSIAVRAMRSVRSIARLGSWGGKLSKEEGAEFGVGEGGTVSKAGGKGGKEKKSKKSKEKEKDSGKEKEKEKEKENGKENAGTIKRKSKSSSKDKDKDKPLAIDEGTIRTSISSFEAGHLSSASPKSKSKSKSSNSASKSSNSAYASLKPETVSKKHSILGLGLPSAMSMSMRMGGMRSGSSASSVGAGGGGFFGTAKVSVSSPHPPPPVPFSSGYATNGSGNAIGSQTGGIITGNSRLSVDSHVDASGRRGSVQSTASSLRPVSITSTISGVSTTGSRISSGRMSTTSGISGLSATSGVTGSAAGSVRWDEEGLERARKEVRGKRESVESSREGGVGGRKRDSSKESGTSRGTKRSVEGRRRKGIVDIFPEIAAGTSKMEGKVEEKEEKEVEVVEEVRKYPIVTIEEATADGHGEGLYDPLSDYEDSLPGHRDDEDELGGEGEESVSTVKDVATPVKKPRARPEAVCEDEDGVLSILSAATNDLAQLINNLDLEATPATPDVTPLRPSLSPFSSEPSASSTGLSRSFSYNGSPLKDRTTLAGSAFKRADARFKAALQTQSQISTNANGNVKGNSIGNANGGESKAITARSSAASISSLRPYAQARSAGTVGRKDADVFGKAVRVPEKVSLADLRAGLRKTSTSSSIGSVGLSPVAASPPTTATTAALVFSAEPKAMTMGDLTKGLPSPPPPGFVRTHKRTITPAREEEPIPVFAGLKPNPRRQAAVSIGRNGRKTTPTPERVRDTFDCEDEDEDRFRTVKAGKGKPSEFTFGSLANTTSKGSKASVASRASSKGSKGSRGKLSVGGAEENRAPMSREARRLLGMSGTMGGSDASAGSVQLDESDPDSDVPEELRSILKRTRSAIDGETVEREDGREMEEEESESEREEEEYRDDSSFTGRLHYMDEEDVTMDLVLDNAPRPPSFSPFKPKPAAAQRPVFQQHRVSCSAAEAEIQQAQRVPVFRAQLVPDTPDSATFPPSAFSRAPPSAFPPTFLRAPTSSNSPSPPHAGVTDKNDGDTMMTTDCFFDDNLTSSDENFTKQSFDFTGELAKLNESGASDRRSFVEQLENAFKTPAKVDLRVDFGLGEVPPVPPMPLRRMQRQEEEEEEEEESYSVEAMGVGSRYEEEESVGVGRAVEEEESMAELSSFFKDERASTESVKTSANSSPSPRFNDESVSRLMDMKQPSIELPSIKSSTSSNTATIAQLQLKKSMASVKSGRSARSNASGLSVDGELNRSFRFGGVPSPQQDVPQLPSAQHNDSFFNDMSTEESEEMHDDKAVPKPMTLADIIPPPAHVRQVSFSSSMLDEYEDSALKSIVSSVQPVPSGAPAVQPRERTVSGASTQDPRCLSAFIPLSRPASGVSFGGLDSFDEVRRGFEFHDYRPDFYTANTSNASSHASSARSRAHLRAQESVFSIASVSSYGRVIRDGAQDPFDFGMAPPLARLRERSFESEEEGDATDSMDFDMSTQVDDTFSFLNHRPAPRRRVDSDASSFYFTSPPVSALRPGHRRRESNMSVSSVSGLPPVSMWNRSFGMGHHRRSSSVTSASSVALSYAHGGIGGRAIMARHRRDASVDSVASEVSMSGRFMARPGLGEKMFGNESEHLGSLKAIAGSPSQSISGDMLSTSDYGYNRTSGSSFDYYDSIIDGPEYRYSRPVRDSIAEEEEEEGDGGRRSGVSDSLFDRTGDVTSSVSSGSVFGDDYTGQVHGGLLPMHQFRPLSVISLGGPHSPMQDDDTMISMLGGGHVRRRSIGSMIDASPCVRMEKKNTHRRTAREVLNGLQRAKAQAARDQAAKDQAAKDKENSAVPTVNAKTVELKPSIASVSSFQFGGDRMIKARHGLLERQSLEESVLIAAGEDLSLSFQAAPVFTRPAPTSRSRSSTCSTSTSTSESSGRDTPPLSACDGYGSSISGASFSSIDTLDMNTALSNAMHPTSTLASARARARDHGHGHRRRYSKAHVSRSSVYETIEEELSSSSPSSDAESVYGSTTKKLLQQSPNDSTAVYVVGSDTESIHNPEECVWDDERGIVALRKFYHLKDEAQYTVQESQRMWMDTPFSLYAVQAFDPPRHPDGMKALLEHSVHTFGPLPAELRRIRSRKNSRASPYPSTRFVSTIPASPAFERPVPSKLSTTSTVFESKPDSAPTPVLKERKLNAKKLNVAPSLEVLKPMSPFAMKVTGDGSPKKAGLGVNGAVRPRVPSAARRSALGWSKRSNGAKTSTDSKKENVVGEGSIVMTPGDSLRLNRPRPRGRTPASQARAIRI